MQYLKIEKDNISKLDSYDKEFLLIETKEDIEKILLIKNEEYIVGSKDKDVIDNIYALVYFLKHYKKLKKILSN